MIFETELKKLGLKDKEAAVYLTCLELGPSAVQPIARKAKVVRATTYVVLESLMHRGLITKYKEGKKTLFTAEPPRQLMRLLEKEHEVIEEKKDELENLLPELQAMMRTAGDRPSVRYFSGMEGLRAIRQEIVMYGGSDDVVYNFTPADFVASVFHQDEIQYYRHRIAKGIKSKTLFTTKSESLKQDYLSSNSKLAELRFIPATQFPSTSGMTIFKNRIAIGTFTGKLGGIIIESETIADMMHRLFEIAWQNAGENNKK